MKSCLYEGRVMHARLEPKPHRFAYPLFMFYLELDELDEAVRQCRLLSRNRFNLFSFWDKDHGDGASMTVREKVSAFLVSKGLRQKIGRIQLLTHVRTLGHIFNPVCFFFCYGEDDEPLCAIAEVENTFHEKKMFYLPPETLIGGRFRTRLPKHFYVSPFIALDATFDFNLGLPTDNLQLFIDNYQDNKRFFVSSLSGQRKKLSDARLLWYAVRFPFMTLQVLGLIHWQAFRLWLRGLHYFPKSHRPDLQQEIYHAKHPS